MVSPFGNFILSKYFLLTLNSTEFGVGHTNNSHAYYITKTMWQPFVRSHNLVCLYGTIGGHRITIMTNNGATHNFHKYTLVKKLRVSETKSNYKYIASLANGHEKSVWDTVVLGVSLTMEGYEAKIRFPSHAFS